MRVMSIVGARPQFVKLRPVSAALRARGVSEYVLHTGQHYDREMSEVFFEALELPRPDRNLGVGGWDHARQVAQMLRGIDETIRGFQPEAVVVFGDTDSTLAGALAASMARVPLAHVEAGMRSFNRTMPEERNRLTADVLADYLYAASPAAERRLLEEAVQGEVVFTGDTMLDVVIWARERASQESRIREELGVSPGQNSVATVHRAENTDDAARLEGILDGLLSVEGAVVVPLHPRTRLALDRWGWMRRLEREDVVVTQPLSYLDTVRLVAGARLVLTDSGGLQKEAFYLGVPCITLRDETEWVETVDCGWNVLAGASAARIVSAARSMQTPPGSRPSVYGAGDAGERVAEHLVGSIAGDGKDLNDRRGASRERGTEP